MTGIYPTGGVQHPYTAACVKLMCDAAGRAMRQASQYARTNPPPAPRESTCPGVAGLRPPETPSRGLAEPLLVGVLPRGVGGWPTLLFPIAGPAVARGAMGLRRGSARATYKGGPSEEGV